MNQHLETLLNFIHQSKELSDDEKRILSNAVQKSNDELEHKNRQLEIEAALEKVRARTMAMQRSDELSETTLLVFQLFKDLGETSEQISIGIFNEDKNVLELYSTLYGSQRKEPAMVDLDEPVAIKKIHTAWKELKKSLVIDLSGDELLKYNSYRKKLSNLDFKEMRWVIHIAFFSKGVLTISATHPYPIETVQLLERFASVFEGTYTRFLDLQKAEAQARESQIELALERVRARTMAMQHSHELQDAAIVLFDQMKALGVHTGSCGFSIWNKKEKTATVWMSSPEGGLQTPFEMPHTQSEIYKEVYEAIKKREDFLVKEVGDLNLKKHFDYLLTLPGIGDVIKKLRETGYVFPETIVFHFAFFGQGYLSFHLHEPHPETHEIFKRFAKVFEQTYTRFLDLQKAEAQAREAQIEAALEKVRSRSLAMHKSDELNEVVTILFEKIKELQIPVTAVGIGIYIDGSKDMNTYVCGENEDRLVINNYCLPYFHHKIWNDLNNTREKQLDFFIGNYSKEEKNSFYKYVLDHTELKHLPDDIKSLIFESMSYTISMAPVNHAMFMINDFEGKSLSENEVDIIKRFARVFDQTYTRFLDLQKAEAQARESQIEASLERVRAKAMAMHNSSDLTDAAGTVFTEFNKLGINPIRTGFVLLSKDTRKAELYPATSFDKETTLSFTGEFEFIGHPVFEKQYEFWQKKENYFPVLEGELLKSYYEILSEGLSIHLSNFSSDKIQYGSFLPFSEGFLFTWSDKQYSEKEINILNRFKDILDLTIRRYLDLQKAEIQTREAHIEAALERVRSKALAMQKGEDLAGAVAVVFDELDKLNLGMIRCGIGILTRENRSADVWTTGISEQGRKAQVSGDESMDIHPLLLGAYDAWLKQKDFSYELKDEDLIQYYNALQNKNFQLPEARSIVESAKIKSLKQFYYVAPFESGNLFAFSETEFPAEVKKVIKRFAEVFNLTYTRFLDLQKAEAQAKEAQLERKRSEDLLLNILPLEVANELKQFGKSYARKHEEVTIMFSDIKGFSSITENLSADELVMQLDECFRAFDKIIEKHGLEKIKTVGDAYICACGLPKPVPDNAAKTVRAAIDMLDFLKGFSISKKIQNLPAFEFRVGIHTGPVITGVVGLKKFTYDIWGDAVNMAARMEQHGEAGKINISGNTYQLIKDKFACTHRGKIQAKNKGEVDMYFVDVS